MEISLKTYTHYFIIIIIKFSKILLKQKNSMFIKLNMNSMFIKLCMNGCW